MVLCDFMNEVSSAIRPYVPVGRFFRHSAMINLDFLPYETVRKPFGRMCCTDKFFMPFLLGIVTYGASWDLETLMEKTNSKREQ